MTDPRAEERRRIAERLERAFDAGIAQATKLSGKVWTNDLVVTLLRDLATALEAGAPTSEPGGEGVAPAVPWKGKLRLFEGESWRYALDESDGIVFQAKSRTVITAVIAALNAAAPDPASADDLRAQGWYVRRHEDFRRDRKRWTLWTLVARQHRCGHWRRPHRRRSAQRVPPSDRRPRRAAGGAGGKGQAP